MKNKELKIILKNMLVEHNNKYSLKNYSFCCSKQWENGLTEYKKLPVYYFNIFKNDYIYLIPSPFFKDYE